MPRLQCTYRQAHTAAEKKVGAGRRTDEWQYECWIDGKFQFKVTLPESHGHDSEPIPIGTLKAIMRQLKLERDEFERWRDCPLSAADYEALMRERLGLD